MPRLRVLFAALLATLVSSVRAQAAPPAHELITCGRERVHILDLDQRDAHGAPKIIWTWQAAGRADLPKEYVPFFRSTDDCKPAEGGRRILITSSTGGVALVERATGAVVFYGRAANPHSADLLPDGRIAVAASRDPRNHQGDALILFDVKTSGRELWRTELPTGHGVVWDAQRNVVWALADQELRSYRLVDWKTSAPKLERVAGFALPEGGGHELAPVPGTALLALTTETKCWVFDRETKTLSPHPTLGVAASVKSISTHPVTGRIAYTQADRPNWWTQRIRFLNPDDSCAVPGEDFYKVRWNAVAE